MYVIQPLGQSRTTVSEAMLTASSVPEVAPAAYNGGTTYSLDAEASLSGPHNSCEVYRSLAPGNTGHTPSSSPTWWRHLGTTYGSFAAGSYGLGDHVIDPANHLEYESLVAANTAPLTDNTKWLSLGPTNRWRALDLNSSTGTTAPSPLSYTITPGRRVDAVGLAAVMADSFTISVKQDGEEVWSYSESMSTRVVRSWRDWLTKGFTFRDTSMVLEMPLVSSAEVTITFYRAGGDVTVGALFINRSVFLGDVETEPTDGADNYSRFARNIEGSATSFIPGRVIPILSATCSAPAERTPEIRALREATKATPAFWAGLSDAKNPYFGAVQRVGVWRRFDITPANPNVLTNLDVEEA